MHMAVEIFLYNEHDLPSSLLTKCPLCPGGLSGIGLGLGPGGQPIDAAQLNRGEGRGAGMGNMGPGGRCSGLKKKERFIAANKVFTIPS